MRICQFPIPRLRPLDALWIEQSLSFPLDKELSEAYPAPHCVGGKGQAPSKRRQSSLYAQPDRQGVMCARWWIFCCVSWSEACFSPLCGSVYTLLSHWNSEGQGDRASLLRTHVVTDRGVCCDIMKALWCSCKIQKRACNRGRWVKSFDSGFTVPSGRAVALSSAGAHPLSFSCLISFFFLCETGVSLLIGLAHTDCCFPPGVEAGMNWRFHLCINEDCLLHGQALSQWSGSLLIELGLAFLITYFNREVAER